MPLPGDSDPTGSSPRLNAIERAMKRPHAAAAAWGLVGIVR